MSLVNIMMSCLANSHKNASVYTYISPGRIFSHFNIVHRRRKLRHNYAMYQEWYIVLNFVLICGHAAAFWPLFVDTLKLAAAGNGS